MSADEHEEFVEIFRDEARERLDAFVETLLAIEGGAASPDAVDALFRDAHTIKGAASMLGLEEIRALAHALEDVLEGAREAGALDPALVEPFLRGADGIRSLVDGRDVPAGLLAELRALTNAPPVAAAAVEPERPATRAREQTVRVATDKLDSLLALAGEAVLHRRRLDHALPAPEVDRLEDELRLGERLLGDLQETALRMRMLPLSTITRPFPRAVRDAAAAAGKEAELVIAGADTELDRVLLETLPEPLSHLLRNAVAHGVESPEKRVATGKPARGRVELRAEQRGRTVTITVADDGGGVSDDALARAATGSLADVLADPGYSTAGAVSDLAGRGVGLDAVKRHVESIGGSVAVESEPGSGTAVTLTLPLTLALIEVLLVERAGSVFGLPLAAVEETVAVNGELSLEGRRALALRDDAVPLVDLAAVLGLPASSPSRPQAVVVGADNRRLALEVDRPLGREEVVVMSLGPLFARSERYLGAAVLGDGRVALLLEIPWLLRRATAAPAEPPRVVAAAPPPPHVLVVEDSLTVRELQRSILESAGYRVTTARDGRDALAQLAADPQIALVVSDLEMPELDGIELTRAIRARERNGDLPVVIVTTHGEDEARQAALEAGADAYVVKQAYDQQAFLATVARLATR